MGAPKKYDSIVKRQNYLIDRMNIISDELSLYSDVHGVLKLFGSKTIETYDNLQKEYHECETELKELIKSYAVLVEGRGKTKIRKNNIIKYSFTKTEKNKRKLVKSKGGF